MELRITEGYGESGLEIAGDDSAFTSCFTSTGLISGAASATASALCRGAASAESAGAGSALLVAGNGNRAFPISCNS